MSMNPARRRAERLDAAIEDPSTAASDARMLELVALVGALREAPRPEARPAFVADLRAGLMLAAETDLTPAPAVRSPAAKPVRSRRERRIAVALGGLAIVGATTSMAVAAQSALPGDALYPLKRAIEDADTTFTTSDDQRGTELLGHASSRLSEIREMSQGTLDTGDTATIETTLTAFADQATEASDLLLADYAATGSEQAITQLRTFTNESLASLGRLETDLPDDLRPAVLQAAQVLFAIDAQASEACPQCGGLGITDIPTGLVSADVALGAALAPLVAPLTTPVLAAPGSGTKKGATSRPATAQPSATPTSPSSPSTAPPSGLGDLGTTPILGGQSKPSTSPSATSPSGGAGGVVGGLGAVVGGVVQGVTGGSGAGATAPAAPLPSLGQVVQDATGALDSLTGTLLDPLTGLPRQP